MIPKLCIVVVLLWTGSAIRTRHDTSTDHSTEKPPLLLSFSGVLSAGEGAAQVTADEEKLMIMIENLVNTSASAAKAGAFAKPNDRVLVDVGKNARYEQEHFFDERVCFTFDLFPADNMMPGRHKFQHLQKLHQWMAARRPAPVSLAQLADEPADNQTEDEGGMSKAEMKHMLFLGAMSDIFQAPLHIYDMAEAAEGVKNITGLSCKPWRVNRSRSMPLSPMMEALSSELSESLFDTLPWWQAPEDQSMMAASALSQLQSAKLGAGLVTVSSVFEFCVTDQGQLLSTESLYRMTYQKLPDEDEDDDDDDETNETRTPETEKAIADVVTIFEKKHATEMLEAPQKPEALVLDATAGVAGGECVDLTQGSTGEQELDEELNGEQRLQRINREAAGHWSADAYDFWKGLKVREVLSSLGTEIGPLRLPLAGARPSFLRHNGPAPSPMSPSSSAVPPTNFDARKQWPKCNSIGIIRNQGRCGSCWAVAAATVMTDRFCVAAQQALGRRGATSLVEEAMNASDLQSLEDMRGLSLAPELLVQCDDQNNGCGGGRLDDAWNYLKQKGIPKESCAPYLHCPVPTQRSCDYGWEKRPFVPFGASKEEKKKDICHGHCADGSSMSFFRVSEAYAVAKPRDVHSLQREVMQRGPVEVAFFVFSDFMNYRSGVYFRTPGAYGPLGGHAVRLLGWGVEKEFERKPVDYWLIANSYSPLWGMHGLFKMRRGTNECGIESTPAAGTPDLGAAGQ